MTTTDTCGHQHARHLRQPGDRPILCTLPANHDGDHGEPETGSHWDRDSLFGNVATGDPRRVDLELYDFGYFNAETGAGNAVIDGEVVQRPKHGGVDCTWCPCPDQDVPGCTCPEVDVTMPAGWRCPVHGAADQDVPA